LTAGLPVIIMEITRIFRNIGIVLFYTSHYVLASCKKLKISNERILRYKTKCLFWAQICPIYPNFGQTRIFNKNRALSLFSQYGCLSSCKKSEKNNEPILRNQWTNEWTDGAEFIGLRRQSCYITLER